MDASRKKELTSSGVCEYVRFAVQNLKWEGQLFLLQWIYFEIQNQWKGGVHPPVSNARCGVPELSAGAVTSCKRCHIYLHNLNNHPGPKIRV